MDWTEVEPARWDTDELDAAAVVAIIGPGGHVRISAAADLTPAEVVQHLHDAADALAADADPPP